MSAADAKPSQQTTYPSMAWPLHDMHARVGNPHSASQHQMQEQKDTRCGEHAESCPKSENTDMFMTS